VFFFAFHWKKQADTGFWQADLQHPFLSVFAVSNVLMTLAFVSIAAILYFLLPGRSLAFTFPALLKLYALKPVYWFVLQFVMMAVFYLHRKNIAKQSPAVFSKAQLRLGWLMALVMQTLVTGAIVGEIGLH
jgi:putative membrane protein